MPKRERVSRRKSNTRKNEPVSQTQTTDTKQGLKDDLDEVLSDIDKALAETEALGLTEQEAMSYVAKGGE